MPHNLYQVLGVEKDASIHAIKKAYREKALFEHPDKGGSAQKMALLTEAYKTLSDPNERKFFDHEREVFHESDDTEIPFTSSGCLPSAGIAFSMSFRRQHGQFFRQCSHKSLDKNKTKSYLKVFRSNLYSSKCDDLFSFIKTKENSETKLDVGLLSPEKAIEYFINFLQGDYFGNTLKDLSKAFYQRIKQLESLGQQSGYEFKLYLGIYEIFLIVVKEKTPTAKILLSLQKITEYVKQNVDQTMNYMAPLLQNKHFRSLFLQAIHSFWLSEESVLDTSYAKHFDGQAEIINFIESLKLKISENRNASKPNNQVAKLLRQVRLLLKLEQDLNKSTHVTSSVFHREKAFHLLDWLPAIMVFTGHEISVNTLLQIGITLQKAASQELNPILRMADEKLAAEIYVLAAGIAHHATPDVELYALVHSVKGLLNFHYTDYGFKDILEALQHRTLWIADMFPFFQEPQSNADFITQEDKTLILMRQFLHSLIDTIGNPKEPSEMDHSYVRVYYQAYEACLKNWYKKNHDPEEEKKFRQLLMNELLESQQWLVDDVNYNLNAPFPLSDLDEQGWTYPKSSIYTLSKKESTPTYKTIHGVEFNFKTGQFYLILDYCEDNESDYNRLINMFDLNELFKRCLTSAIFSLDPVEPDMPYHPFNQMRFVPSALYHSQLLHTMFITDYLLKFLTVGQEVQCRDPYDLRSLDKITSSLPNHLRKIIYDFHSGNHEESLHRFWIEAEEVDLAVDEGEGDIVLFALGKIRMVVKQHKMKRDAEGNLVDKEGENEGWDCYVLNEKQKRELYNGKRIIEDSALIFIENFWKPLELIFWENQKAALCFTLQEEIEDFINLSKLPRDNREKVKTNSSKALSQVYRLVSKAAEKTNMPNRYSPEFKFAQEFTKYYDEFAIHFPEFGRLRELSKAVALVRLIAAQRTCNQKEILKITQRLQYREFGDLKYDEEKNELKRLESLDNIRKKIGDLKFTESSPEVQEKCNIYYAKYRCGNDSKEANEPLISGFIKDLEAQKKSLGRKLLLKKFECELSELSGQEITELVCKFLDGNSGPLLKRLIIYDKQLLDKNTKEADNYWETMKQKLERLVREDIVIKFAELRGEYSKEKIELEKQKSLDDIRQQIGSLEFTRSSPEIREICDKYYEQIKNDFVAEHGYRVWNSVSHRVHSEAIEPKIPKLIRDMRAQKKEAYHKQLTVLFKNQLSELSDREAIRVVDKFLEGDSSSLRERLVCHSKTEIAKQLQKVYYEHSLDILDRALNNSSTAIHEIVYVETAKTLKEHEQQIKEWLNERKKLEQSFVNIGFGDDMEEIDLEGTCLWVPASFRHDVEIGKSRTVYGGVSILTRIKECVTAEDMAALLRQTRTIAKRLQQNRMAGNAVCKFFRENIVAPLYSGPEFKIETNYYIKTKYGRRFLDIAVLRYCKEKEKFEILKSFEVKIGKSSYRRQKKIDDWLFEQGIIKSPVILRRFKISPHLFMPPETQLTHSVVESLIKKAKDLFSR